MAFKNLMARGEGDGERSVENPPEPPVTAHRTVAPPSSCIDASSEFSGTIRSPDSIRIDGRLKGEVHGGQKVIVGKSAILQARIEASTVVIAGEVKGDIAATSKITLEQTARVTGDLRTPGIVIEEGAKLEGRIVIAPNEQPAEAKQPAPRSAAKARESSGDSAAAGANPPGP